MSCTSVALPCLVLWDFAAAFASMIHEWIFAILYIRNIPESYVNVVRGIYFMNATYISMTVAVEFFCWICSGVLHGCPLSGTLFALAVDPVLHMLEAQLDSGKLGVMRACADDIGAALASASVMQKLYPVFRLAKLATGLTLNVKKCIVIPTYCRCTLSTVAVWRDWFSIHLPEWRGFKICGTAKYLGMYVGPSAGTMMWIAQTQKWMACTRAVFDQGASAAISAQLYNSRCLTVLAYVAQFCPPTAQMCTKEHWCLAKMLHVSFRAFPSWLYFHLDSVGGVPLRSLQSFCRASIVRFATSIMDCWQAAFLSLRGAAENALPFAKVVGGKLSPDFWDTAPFVCNLLDALQSSSSVPLLERQPAPDVQSGALRAGPEFLVPPVPVPYHFVSIPPVEQRDAYWSILNHWYPPTWDSFVLGKIGRILSCSTPTPNDFPPDVFLQTIKEAPNYIAMSVLKTLANAWTTSRRMHASEVRRCIFGCDDIDCLSHYICCSTLSSAVASALGDPLPIPTPNPSYLFPCPFATRKDVLRVFAFYFSYHYMKHTHRTPQYLSLADVHAALFATAKAAVIKASNMKFVL